MSILRLARNGLSRAECITAPGPEMVNAERWPSGRRRTPGKCVGGEPSQGFESLSLRHKPKPLNFLNPVKHAHSVVHPKVHPDANALPCSQRPRLVFSDSD